MLFKNKTFMMKMIDDKKPVEWDQTLLSQDSGVTFTMNPQQISDTASEFVTKTAVTFGLVYSGIKILNTICNVVEIAAKSKLK